MPDEDPGLPAAEFHVASRNLKVYKRMYKAHEVHYAPFVQELVASAPVAFDGNPRVALPPGPDVLMTVEDAIHNRISGRKYGDIPLSAAQLGTILRLANGVHETRQVGDMKFFRRPAANSGDLGSVEIFPVVLDVSDVPQGIYHFDSVRHDLARLYDGDFREWLRDVVFFQLEFAAASTALILTSAAGRLSAKYGPRGYRLALLDVGHVSQNVYLVSTGLGLQVCATAGFIDDELDQVLGLDGLDVASMLILLIGTTGPITRTDFTRQ